MSTQQPQAQTSNLAEALVASGLVKNVKLPQPERLTNSINVVNEPVKMPAPIISVPNYQSQNKNKKAQSNIDFSAVTSQRNPTQIKLSPIENIYVDRQANGSLPKLKLKPEGPSIRSDAPGSDLSFLHDRPQKKDSNELTNEEILRSIPSNEPITFPRTMLLSTTLGKPQIASRANYENLNGLLQHLVSQIELNPDSSEEEKIVAQRDAFNTVMSEIVRQGFYECSEKGDLFNNMRTYMNQTADQIPVLTNKLQKVREAAQNQIAALKSENDDLEKKNEALSAKYNILEKDQNRLQTRLKFAEDKIPQLEENTRILRLKNQETEIKASETLKKLEKVKEKKGKLKTLKIENQSIIEEMGKQIQELLDFKEKAQDTIFFCTDENDRLKKINIELKKEIEALKEATNELAKKLEIALKESKKDTNRVNEQTQTAFFSKQSNYGSSYRNNSNNNNNSSSKNNNKNNTQNITNVSSRNRNQLSYSKNNQSDTSDSDSYYYYDDEEETKDKPSSSKSSKSNKSNKSYTDFNKKEKSNKTSVSNSPISKHKSKNQSISNSETDETRKLKKTSKNGKRSKSTSPSKKSTVHKHKNESNESEQNTTTENDNESENDNNYSEPSTSNKNENEEEQINEKVNHKTEKPKSSTKEKAKRKHKEKESEDTEPYNKNDDTETGNDDDNNNENVNNEDSTISATTNGHKKRKKHKSKNKQVNTVEEIRKLKKDFDACQEFVGDITLDSFKKLKETILERNGRFVANNENLMMAQDGSFEIDREEDGPPTEAYKDTLKMFVHNLMNRVMDKACYTVFFATIGIQSTDIDIDFEEGQVGTSARSTARNVKTQGNTTSTLGGFPSIKSKRILLVDRETMCFSHELKRDDFKDNFTRLLDPTYSDRPPRSFEWMMKSIKSIYDEKTVKDAKDLKDMIDGKNEISFFHAMQMPLFALQWSMRQYGLEYLAHQCCWDLVNTARAHQLKAAEIETFRKFLDEDLSTTQLTFFLRMRTICMRRGITLPVNIFVDEGGEKDPNGGDDGSNTSTVVYNQVFLTTSIAIDIIQKVFQKADKDIVDAAVKAVKHDVVRKPSPTADSSVTYVSMITVLNHSIEAFQNYELNELRKLMLCCQIKPKMDSKAFRLLVKDLIPSSNEQNISDLYRLLLSTPFSQDNSAEKVTISKKKFIDKFNSRSLLSKENAKEAFEIEKYYSTSPELEAVKNKWKSLLPLLDDALGDAEKREKNPSLSHEMLCLKLDIDNVNSSLTCFDVVGAHKNILTCIIQYQELLWTFKEPEIESMDETTNSIMNILKI